MNKIIPLLLLVALSVAAGWILGSITARPEFRHHPPSKERLMAWLQKEYQLTPEQYVAVKKAHDEFWTVCRPKFDALHAREEALRTLEDNDNAKMEEIEKQHAQLDAQRDELHALLQTHIQHVASLMSPEQAARYLKRMEEREKHRP